MLKVLFSTVLICFVINMPIGYSLGLASVAALYLNGGVAQMLMIPQRIVAGMNSFPPTGHRIFHDCRSRHGTGRCVQADHQSGVGFCRT